MSNRVIKDSLLRSPQVDSLTWFEEAVFVRMILTADDYGILDGRAIVLRNTLFPTKDDVTRQAIEKAVSKLVSVGLILPYEVEGCPYIKLRTWEKHQRIREARHHYPLPPESAETRGNLRQIAANCGELPQTAENGGLNPIQSNPNPNPNPNPPPPEAERARARGRGPDYLCRYLPELTANQWDDLRELMADLGEHADELLIYAVDEAKAHGSATWAYVQRILNALVSEGVKTVEQARRRRKAGTPADRLTDEERRQALEEWGGSL